MHPPLSLEANDVHIWLADYSEINDEQLKSEYRTLLSEPERAQEPRFYFAKDRLRYLVTRALVRIVLSKYATIRPQDWTFALNTYGRPEISNDLQPEARLSFNISHTHSLIVLGVTMQRDLGVDVENISQRDAPIEIADRYFSPAEASALAQVPSNGQHERFFEYWTFKESYIKARGMGLSLPLEKFSFHFPAPERVSLEVDPELLDDSARWELWQLRPDDGYLVAVCAEIHRASPAKLTARKIVPLDSERVLDMRTTRWSGRTG